MGLTAWCPSLVSSGISVRSVCFRTHCAKLRQCHYLHAEHIGISGVLLIWPAKGTGRLYFCLQVGCSTCLPYCPFHYPGVYIESPLLPLKEMLNLLFTRSGKLPLKQHVLVLSKKCTVIADYYTPKWDPFVRVKGREKKKKKKITLHLGPAFASSSVSCSEPFTSLRGQNLPSVKGLHI